MKAFPFLLSASAVLLAGCAQTEMQANTAGTAQAAQTTLVSAEAFAEEGYTITTETITQPIDHAISAAGTFQQQVLILRPDGVPDDAPVFFMLGNETDSTAQRLRSLYHNYGSPKDVIFITADHRGYGQSIAEQDQARPSYVAIDHALADYDLLIKHYKHRFAGQWLGGGCSYGGALVINFAHDYPDHFEAVIASSAPTRFEFETPEYSIQAEANLGPELSARLMTHMTALKPAEPYDDNWIARERLVALISGFSQLEELQPAKPAIAQMAALSTPEFMAALQTSFPPELLARLDDWAVRRKPVSSLPAALVRHGNYNWYTWKYQQCRETGTFFTGGLFPQTRADHIADCRATFGEEPRISTATTWPVASMLGEITMPVLVVSGGRDPWMQVGVGPTHGYSNIDYAYYPDALHCPDVYGEEVGSQVFSRVRDLVRGAKRD